MISSTIKMLRKDRRLTQKNLANILHVNRVTYCYYETGRNHPSLEILYALAEFHQVPLDAILGRISLPCKCIAIPREVLDHSLFPTESQLLAILGTQLRLIRLKRDFTQDKLAKLLGISRPAYSHYENGTRQLSLESLLTLADFYDISVDWLCGRTQTITL